MDEKGKDSRETLMDLELIDGGEQMSIFTLKNRRYLHLFARETTISVLAESDLNAPERETDPYECFCVWLEATSRNSHRCGDQP